MNGLRHQFLARARFARDEHRGRGRRRLLDDLIDLPHLRAAADHLPVSAVLAKLLAQHLHFAQRVLPFDDLVEQDLEALWLDRFRQVVVGPFLHRLDRRLDRSLRGQDNYGVVSTIVLERPQQFEAVTPGHDEIADDDRRPEHGDALKGLFTVASGVGRETPCAHKFCQSEPRAWFVLDDEDPFAGCWGHSCCLVLIRILLPGHFYTVRGLP